jgi:hypothetical protein
VGREKKEEGGVERDEMSDGEEVFKRIHRRK